MDLMADEGEGEENPDGSGSSSESEEEENAEQRSVPIIDGSTGESMFSVNMFDGLPPNTVGLTFEAGEDDAPPTFYVLEGDKAASKGTAVSVTDLPWTMTDSGQLIPRQVSPSAAATVPSCKPSTASDLGECLSATAATVPTCAASIFNSMTGASSHNPSVSSEMGESSSSSAAMACAASMLSAMSAQGPRQRPVGLHKPQKQKKKSVAGTPATRTPSASAGRAPPVAEDQASTSRADSQSVEGTPVAEPSARRNGSVRQLSYTNSRSEVRQSQNKKKTELYCNALAAETAHWERMGTIDQIEEELKKEQIELVRLKIKKLRRELGEE